MLPNPSLPYEFRELVLITAAAGGLAALAAIATLLESSQRSKRSRSIATLACLLVPVACMVVLLRQYSLEDVRSAVNQLGGELTTIAIALLFFQAVAFVAGVVAIIRDGVLNRDEVSTIE